MSSCVSLSLPGDPFSRHYPPVDRELYSELATLPAAQLGQRACLLLYEKTTYSAKDVRDIFRSTHVGAAILAASLNALKAFNLDNNSSEGHEYRLVASVTSVLSKVTDSSPDYLPDYTQVEAPDLPVFARLIGWSPEEARRRMSGIDLPRNEYANMLSDFYAQNTPQAIEQ